MRRVLRVIGIGRLEPGARETEIQIDGVGLRRLEIEAIEDVLLIAVIVDRPETPDRPEIGRYSSHWRK